MQAIVKILDIILVTHDVKSFRIEKPDGFHFTPGQATDVSVNKLGFSDQLRPFTFTSTSENPWLEFTIKRYEDHHGITDLLHRLVPGDELIIRDVWGAIEYKGPGYFIAGGAGITPFLAILRDLHIKNEIADNQLFFSNRTSADIIYEQELMQILGSKAHFIVTRETNIAHTKGHIDEAFIRRYITDLTRPFYICGPDKMVTDLIALLKSLGAKANTLVFEK